MADIDSTLRLWSATASSNKPTGATSIGTGLDDNLRQIQATVRQFLASPGSTIASAATVDLSTADGHSIPISGTATVTGFGTEVSGIEYLLTTTGAVPLINSSALSLPGAVNITTAAGDYFLALSKGSGNWVVPWLTKAAVGSAPPFSDISALIRKDGSATSSVRFSASVVTAARIATMPDYDVRFGNLPAGIGPLPYSGSSIPTGWLYCNGSAVSRATYADLFTAIGTTWGVGDGSTTFNLPDVRGRVAIGDGTGTVAETITAQTAAANAIPVASNNTKWITGMMVDVSGSSGFGGTGLNDGTHYVIRVDSTHLSFAASRANAQNGTAETLTGTGSCVLTTTWTERTLGENGGEEAHAMSLTEMLAHTHLQDQFTVLSTGGAVAAVAGSGVTVGGTTQSRGGNAAMNIMNPFLVVKYIISY